ncbi:P-loop containing nucleoside triphosphate hydrolase protein [Byssothecium circinans]|uniref:P-loop containing nucleoside triphosphate hydrolase protein n=1 Tax=Byssothecium circinans TaxID=147558 RepID=A0A6A5UCQ8_9PLEO|nr:P-loop containing nucleoside triphosphate hydrolase protein [Byssothecium circinans]
MAGATRASTNRKQPARSTPASSQAQPTASSGSTIPDDRMHAPNGSHGQEFEPMSIETDEDRGPSEVEVLGVQLKEAVAVINRLVALGLERHDIPLPKCIVLGEQSTGKSSVIEAISGIKTPRSTDTCTRCPLYIQLEEPSKESSKSWHAKILIRHKYIYDGISRTRFPNWKKNPNPVEEPFAETKSPLELEELIARAQLAVLSPDQPSTDFLHPDVFSRDSDTYHQCDFSPNIVCIYISQLGLPSLSFYDLPGIIGQAEKEDAQFLVKFVRDLVSEYVLDPQTLVLVTCSLENDLANSTVTTLARELGASERCIGVLTKPDRLPACSRVGKLEQVLAGRRFPLGHGYFVVKNPPQDDINRGVSHRHARAQEQQFFSTNEPWTTTDFQAYQSRFGSANLQRALSTKLTYQIKDLLPIILEQVKSRLDKVNSELSQLPEPPASAFSSTRIISDILLAFSNDVGVAMRGKYPQHTWGNTWKALCDQYLDALLSMKPAIKKFGQLDAGIFKSSEFAGKSVGTSIAVDSDDDEDMGVSRSDSPKTPSKKRKVEDSGGPTSRFQTPSRTPRQPTFAAIPNQPGVRKVFDLDDFAAHLRNVSVSTIPHDTDSSVINDLIIENITHWDLPTGRFFGQLESKMREVVKSIFSKRFGYWQDSPLCQAAGAIIDQVFKNHLEQQRSMAQDSLADEYHGPFLYDEQDYEELRTKTLGEYRVARKEARKVQFAKEALGPGFDVEDARKLFLRDAAAKQALFEKEPYEKEIVAISRVTTYYTFAAKRLRSNVCGRISSKFLSQLAQNLRDELENNLGIHDENGPQTAMHLLAEPTYRAKQRQELHNTKEALQSGLKHLESLQGFPLSSQQSTNGFVSFGSSH